MHNRDAVFLEDLCPKLRDRRWRKSLHERQAGTQFSVVLSPPLLRGNT